jgi:ribosome maturation factor RimP
VGKEPTFYFDRLSMEKIEEIVKKNAERLGLIILDMRIRGETIEATLYRKNGGLTVEDLENSTRLIQEDLTRIGLERAYSINLFSPGLDRVLKSRAELDIFSGKTVKFLYSLNDILVTETGILKGNEGENVAFETEEGLKLFPFVNLRKVTLFEGEFKDRKKGRERK